MRETRPELFVDIPVKNEKSNVPINLSMPLTNALPVTVSETTSLMKEITFELASISTTNQDTTSTNKWDALRRHVRNTSEGSLFDHPSKTNSPSVELTKKGPLRRSSSFEDSKKKDIKKIESITPSRTITSNDDSNKKKEPTNVFKGGSLLDYDDKNPPIKPTKPEQVTFAKGSLLSNGTIYEQAKEREKVRKALGGVGIIRDSNNGTLLHIGDSVKFNKGSLLDRNIKGSGNKTLQRKKSMGNSLRQNQQ